MSFTALREGKQLSQEMLAQASGISLRTIQRLEAGHRVSYATLRAVAPALGMDVDVLERQLYAAQRPGSEFVEVPRWVRRLRAGLSYGAAPMQARHAVIYEALMMGLGLAFVLAAWCVASEFARVTLLLAGIVCLVGGYGLSVASRVLKAYDPWPAADADAGTAGRTALPSITWPKRLLGYLAALVLASAFVLAVVLIAN